MHHSVTTLPNQSDTPQIKLDKKISEIQLLLLRNPSVTIPQQTELGEMLDKLEQMTRKNILKQHPYKIWQGKDGRWRTYISDVKSGRVLIAKTELRNLEDAIITGYKSNLPTIKEVFTDWIDYKLSTNSIAKNTADRYTNDFDTYFIKSNLDSKPITEITEKDIEKFIDDLLTCNLTQKGFSNIRTVLFGLFKYSKKQGYTSFSITSIVNDIEISRKSFKKNIKSKEEQIFTMNEITQIMEYCDTNPTMENLAVAVVARIGVRIGEIATIKFSDIEGNTIHIQRTEIKYKNDSGKTVYEVRETPKTEAGDRNIYITDKVFTILTKLKSLPHKTDYVFEVNGHWMQSFYYDRAIRRICKALHIPVRSMHKLRRTYGTLLINSHLEDSLILSQMGHTSIETTRKYYYYDNIEDTKKRTAISQTVTF